MNLEQMKNLPKEEQEKIIKRLKDVRKSYKMVNYSATYGVGAAKLARSSGLSPAKAKELLEAYWKRNWAIKRVSETQKIKVTGPYMWLKNPVSGFWHNLRAEKDTFSTLNQSTGVFCFDTWVAFCRKAGLQNCGQFHDETIFPVEKGKEEWAMEIQKQAIAKTNMKLKLNIQLDVSPQFGVNYAEIH
jgi:DNA polymerase I-like protein with 3'-5' exonuclease and polymerase domains